MRRCVANKNGMYRCKFKVTNLVKLEVPYGDKFRFCVNFMEQCPGKIAGIYRWPNPPDELWVSLSDILKRIPEPLNFGFLCRTYLKGYLNCCQMEEVNK
jgi:hypothetical protein